jgi:hypothetical protein
VEWRAILRAPFSGTFRATLADAGTLAALATGGIGIVAARHHQCLLDVQADC